MTLFSASTVDTIAQVKTQKKPAQPAPAGDIKVRSRMTTSGQSFESMQYIKGARQRTEMNMQGGFVSLMQCDLKRTVQINDTAKTYLVQSFGDAESSTEDAPRTQATRSATPPQQKRGGVITYVYKTTDTGERKEMFGFTARRIKTSMTTESTPDACNQTKMRMDTDGWYIDLDNGLDCQNAAAYGGAQAGGRPDCRDTVKSKTIGSGKLGYPLDVTTTFYQDNGSTMVSRTEVIELSRATLDAALFDIPAGYTEAQDYQQLVGATPISASRAGHSSASNYPDDNAGDAGANKSAPVATTKTQPVTTGVKKPGVVRVGVVTPKAQMGQSFAGVEVAEPVRAILLQQLNAPAVEVTAINATVQSQIDQEAREKECDFILYSNLWHKEGGGGGIGGLLKKARPLGIGGTSVTSTSGTTGGGSAAGVSGNIKAKDEVTIAYKLVSVAGSSPTLTDTFKAKAKSDREDLISSLITQLTAAVLDAVIRR